MSKEKLILDIRYFESESENISGQSLPSSVGKIYSFPQDITSLASRIARKLREYNFITGSFDHIYINFSSVFPEGQISISSRTVEKWMQYIDVGLNPDYINSLSEVDKLSIVEEITFKVLAMISNEDQKNIIERVKKELSEKNTELEILHKVKETKSYMLKLTYQINPNGKKNSLAKIYYLDKKTGNKFDTSIELEFYEDIFFLASSISCSKGYIHLKPRTSFKAEIYNERYDVPISIAIK